MKKKIYIAGPYTSKSTPEVFNNIRKGIRTSLQVLNAGYAPFVPWFDFLFFLTANEFAPAPTVKTLQEASMAWLAGSDAVLVLFGYENSKGTQAEIAKAKELGIPVYYTIEELKHAVPK